VSRRVQNQIWVWLASWPTNEGLQKMEGIGKPSYMWGNNGCFNDSLLFESGGWGGVESIFMEWGCGFSGRMQSLWMGVGQHIWVAIQVWVPLVECCNQLTAPHAVISRWYPPGNPETPQNLSSSLSHPTAHVPFTFPQILLLFTNYYLNISAIPSFSFSCTSILCHSMFVYQICVCVMEEQSPNDVCVAIGSCEMEWGRVEWTDYWSRGVTVSVGAAAAMSV
jgi:hypothetical protein